MYFFCEMLVFIKWILNIFGDDNCNLMYVILKNKKILSSSLFFKIIFLIFVLLLVIKSLLKNIKLKSYE